MQKGKRNNSVKVKEINEELLNRIGSLVEEEMGKKRREFSLEKKVLKDKSEEGRVAMMRMEEQIAFAQREMKWMWKELVKQNEEREENKTV